MGVLGKHNGPNPAVGTLDEKILNLMDPRWRGYMAVFAQPDCRLRCLADELELQLARWRHLIRRITISSLRHPMKSEQKYTDPEEKE